MLRVELAVLEGSHRLGVFRRLQLDLLQQLCLVLGLLLAHLLAPTLLLGELAVYAHHIPLNEAVK